MDLTLFDLDHTLIPLDSDHAWGEFTIGLGWHDGDSFRSRNDAFYADYQAGRLDLDEYIAFATQAIRSRGLAAAREAHRRFMQEVIEPAIRPAARELVQRHREAGDLIAIVTATNEFVTRPIADAFGVEHLMAVQLERDARGELTGRIQGVPSYQAGKVTRVTQWLEDLGEGWASFERIHVYSDSVNDLPLLERATHPVATNPSEDLKAVAQARGWPMLSLFS